ncbi:ATP-binding protein [Pseudomonas aeruginosa]|uniref:ATP-binding protein n=1 Tax=Pseudomonas aeruginosa TaxID=287 RepID=UPI000F7F1231|nr:ATP-binding protein [Pseudomonas aeruginosa]RTB44092.1 ATP-binding protein [Pseudomonas aeruginosa]
MNTIHLQTNQHQLIANLRHAFTPYSMLGELLQNARRAQASLIQVTVEENTLTISDDGIGIADLQSLIRIAESGWSEELRARENAFGMGVLSTLYFAQTLSVHSGSQAFSASTSAIIRGEAIEVLSRDWREGTEIRLVGVQPPGESRTLNTWVQRELKKLCEAFPVRVLLNGVEICRPLADPTLRWRETPMGKVLIDLSEHPRYWKCFLQGLPISQTSLVSGSFGRNVVMLRDDVLARLPDRQYLLNEKEDCKRIDEAVKDAYRQVLIDEKARLAGSEFVLLHAAMCLKTKNADLLNDIPLAPREWFRDWTDKPAGYHEPDRFSERKYSGALLSQEEIQDTGVWFIESFLRDKPTAEVYLEAQQARLLEEGGLHADHWLMQMAKFLKPERVRVKCGRMLHEVSYLPLENHAITQVALFETLHVCIVGSGEAFAANAICAGETLYLTPQVSNATRFVSSYVFDDRYDASRRNVDEQAIAEFIAVGGSDTPAGLIGALLPDSVRYAQQPKLAGTTIRLVFNGEGFLQEIQA